MQTALITGATSGIGYALAEALAGTGRRVIAVGRQAEALKRLAATPNITPKQHRPLLLTRLPRLLPQHLRQLVSVRIELARPIGNLNFGSSLSKRRYLRTVFRDRFVRRAISRIEKCSRKRQRRMTLNNSMSITPLPPGQAKGIRFEHGSVLGGKT